MFNANVPIRTMTLMSFLLTFDSSCLLSALPHVPLHAPSPSQTEAPLVSLPVVFLLLPHLKCSKDSALGFTHFIFRGSSRSTVLTGTYVCVMTTSVSVPPSLSCTAGGYF